MEFIDNRPKNWWIKKFIWWLDYNSDLTLPSILLTLAQILYPLVFVKIYDFFGIQLINHGVLFIVTWAVGSFIINFIAQSWIRKDYD